jgi:1,4-dihydroxy-2-naphthoyl-CoA hydrolase
MSGMAFSLDEVRDLASNSFPASLGMELGELTRERVTGRLSWRDDLTGDGRILHGGVLMTFADALGAFGAAVNLREGCATATLESKTNFFRPVAGGVVEGESVPLHLGRNAMVWQTSLRLQGKLVVQTVQTQIVIHQPLTS